MNEMVPEDFPVKVLKEGDEATSPVTCGNCGRTWDDAIATEWTPTPAGRCPFEYFHAVRVKTWMRNAHKEG